MIFETRFDLQKSITNEIYNNTKLLLKEYSQVYKRIRLDLTEMNNIFSQELDDELLGHVDANSGLEQRLFNARNSRSILVLIENAGDMLQEYPGKGSLYFDILSKTYLNLYPCDEKDLMDCFGVSRSTLYKLKREAIGTLGVIMWGMLMSKAKGLHANHEIH